MGELFGYLILAAFLGYVIYALVRVAKDLREKFRIRATRLRQKSFDKERAKQLSDLKASVPSTPPERMRATIRVNSFTAFTTISARREEQDLETTHYAVDMIVELSERDRATILEHHLDQIVMEKVPTYLAGEILTMMVGSDAEYNSTTSTTVEGILHRQIMDQHRKTYEGYAAERKEIKLAAYMKTPYSRIFETMPEANDYSDELKGKLLPKVKDLLDRNVNRQTSTTETVEF